MNYPELIFSADRVKRLLRVVKDALRGQPETLPAEEFGTLDSDPFAPLREVISTTKAALDKAPRDAQAEMRLALAAASYRDMCYSNAGRIHLNRLQLNNRIRGAFEGSRLAKDNSL